MPAATGGNKRGARANPGDPDAAEGSDHDADQIDHEKRAQLGRREPERRSRKIEGDVGEGGHQGKEHVESDREGRQQLRIAEVTGDVGFLSAPAGKRRVMRQPAPEQQAEDEVENSDGDESIAPTGLDERNQMVGGRNSGKDASEKTAENRAADVDRHHLGHAMARPLFGNVGDGDAKDSGHGDALEETPEDQLRKPVRGGGKDGGQGKQEDGEHDDLAASDALGQRAAEGRAEGNAEGCGTDGAPDLRLGGVEDLLEERQQRLGGIEIEECADPSEGHRDDRAGIASIVGGYG